MSKFNGITLETLNQRLGQPSVRGMGRNFGPGIVAFPRRYAFHMVWYCNGRNAPACSATAQAGERPVPPDLTPWEQELFDHAPFPEEGWTLKPCPHHRNAFADRAEEPH